jgi:alpha-2-macroglobulin
MLSFIRAGLAAALLAFAPHPAGAAEKSFQDQRLADSAVTLEAQIKGDAGKPAKPLAQIRRDADAAFTKNDFRGGMALLGQIVALAPNDSATWLRLARTVMQIRPADDNEKNLLLERASTAAYIAYQRTTNRAEEADSLAFLGNVMGQREQWRAALDALRLSLELREVADVRGLYEKMRDEHGFRVLDYSVDSDTASPRACFQFSEDLPRRTDFSPFVVLAGADKPALSAAEKQLCVEGLQHGASYTVTLRTGLPSTVHETLSKSADFSIYVRDRKPAVHFSSTAYVLPRTGQRGIPVISTNTRAIAVEIFRIGDRNLAETVGGEDTGRGDFQRGLSRYEVDQLRGSRGIAVWKGELAVEASPLNADVTTAFPVDQAIGDVAPGVYVMVAQPQETKNLDTNFDSLATQWFIVSDLGITAFSGNDGIHVFVNSLASAQGKTGIEVRLISRGNEVLATRRTDAAGHVQFEARARRRPPW